jgi:hypothetical protein
MEKISLKNLKKFSDFEAVKRVHRDGSVTLKYNHVYEGDLEFYFETGFESLASILCDDRGVDSQGFKTLNWAVFFNGGEFLQVYKKNKLIWEGVLVRDFKRIMNPKRKHTFTPFVGISDKKWIEWFKEGHRGVVSTLKPVFAESDK